MYTTISLSDTSPYSNNMNCQVTIYSPEGFSVGITFLSFVTEDTFDKLFVYLGPSTASPQFGVFTGSTPPGVPVYSST